MDAIFFDLDGTLVDSAPEIRECLLESLREQAVPLSAEAASRFQVGPPLDAMIRVMAPLLSDDVVRAVVGSFRARYDRSDFLRTLPFPGVDELLHMLAGEGIPLYVATNKPLYASTRIVQKKGWRCFDAILSPDSESGKFMTKAQMLQRCAAEHAYCPRRCVLVGDLPDDVEAARKAGFLSVCAGWGYGDTAKRANWGADWIIDAPADLLTMLRTLRNV